MDYLKLTKNRLSVEEITDLVSAPTCGAISIFCGITRDNCDGKEVTELEYEAYESMALKVMKEICNEMRTNWAQIENIAIYHRLGNVPVKQASVVIAVSSPHRADAIESTQYCIENLKSRIPIWKKEKYKNNEPPIWKENKECPWSNFDKERKSLISIPVVQENTQDDEDLVQIKASNAEINQRIEKFMEHKRELLNITNVLDFCVPSTSEDSDDRPDSCARVDAVLIRRKDSKSHLRITRVYNPHGPLTTNSTEFGKLGANNGIEERLSNAEQYLLMGGPVPADIYERIKRIEERILQLESLSPEYYQFWKNLPSTSSLPPLQRLLANQKVNQEKNEFTIKDINDRIVKLEEELEYSDS